MATKSKEKLTPEKSTSTRKTKEKSASASPASAQKTPKKEACKAATTPKKRTRKTKTDESVAEGNPPDASNPTMPIEPLAAAAEHPPAQNAPSQLVANRGTGHRNGTGGNNGANHGTDIEVSGQGITFLAADCITEDIWVPNTAIPTIDQATYESRKTQVEGQRRAIEVASLNLKNINDLHQLEGQSLDVAMSAKANETRTAQLTGADLDYQTQLEVNGKKSQQLKQAAAKRESATRETGYTDQLISLKDQNFELEIQQAQTVFAEKAARYRAQLTGQ